MSAPRTPPTDAQREAVDRARWEVLRTAARNGRLQPEGDRALQEIHARHPEWRKEFL